MSADRYDVDMHDDGTFIITNLNGHRFIVDANCVDIRSRAIRQQARDIAALKDALADEVTANEAFRKAGGARDDEDMPTFCARLIAESEIGRQWNADSSLAKWFPLTAERVDQDAQEIAKLRTDLAAAVAERDSYRDEFSGLCHALSVGSEGRPEMTAADWRKRVDDGVEFLLRPLIAQRDELVAAYEFARHVVRDDPGITPRGALIRQSDEIGRLCARLAAIESGE